MAPTDSDQRVRSWRSAAACASEPLARKVGIRTSLSLRSLVPNHGRRAGWASSAGALPRLLTSAGLSQLPHSDLPDSRATSARVSRTVCSQVGAARSSRYSSPAMNLPPGIEKLWTGLVPIAFPVWISGLVILLWPARVYDFLELQPIRDKWGSVGWRTYTLLLHALVLRARLARAAFSERSRSRESRVPSPGSCAQR